MRDKKLRKKYDRFAEETSQQVLANANAIIAICDYLDIDLKETSKLHFEVKKNGC